MKAFLCVITSTAVTMFTFGCANMRSANTEHDLIAIVSADKNHIRFGEEVTLSLQVRNLSDTTADFSPELETAKIKGQKEPMKISWPRCMWGLFNSKTNTIQTAASVPGFQLPPGETYQLQAKFTLARDKYPFPSGVYFGEFRGAPKNQSEFRFTAVPVIITVTE